MAYLGNIFIFGSTICVVASIIFYFISWRGKADYKPLARKFYFVSFGLILLAIADLLYLIITHDFTVAYVYSYSSTDLPLGYLISTLWGGQEGTFLLWGFYVSLMGIVLMATAKDFENGTMFVINLFILSLLLIMIKKSPFEMMPVFRAEGAGLNPLLQNFWMQIHPPIMFVGFAAAVFPYSFAIAGLIDRKYHTWAESARRWTLFAWSSLGISLVMGGYWAYVTLGWGGFWAWDPVENSSFIPWIFLTTQVHALFIKRQRRGLMRFSIFVAILTFCSVLYGTFLTRSGVLADFSVHSFVDLGINQFLIVGMILFSTMGAGLLIYRWQDIKPEPSFSKVNSRLYLVTLGVVVLFLGGILVLLGTSAPLLTRITDNPSNVGISYYFITMTPIATAIMLLLYLFPAFKWNEGLSKPKLLIQGGVVALVTVLFLMISGFTYEIIYQLFFAFAAAAIYSNLYVIVKSLRSKNFAPGYLAHVGLSLALTGAALSAGFAENKTVTLKKMETVVSLGCQLKFVDVVERETGYDCHVEVIDGDYHFTAILPHDFPKNAEGVMKKPHVEKFVTYDLYLAPVAMQEAEGEDPGMFTLLKGETIQVDKYQVTFHEFVMGSHDSPGSDTKAEALLSVAYDGKTEEVRPYLEVSEETVEPKPATFDYNKGTVYIAGISPETGSVMLQFMGDFLPRPEVGNASLVIEFSKKPFINLFWMGTIIIFLSGIMSMTKRRKRLSKNGGKSEAEIKNKIEIGSV